MTNQGQVCTAGSRVFVHESIYDEFVAESVTLAATLKIGDPFDKANNFGPIVRVFF